jgi:TctA family transporter
MAMGAVLFVGGTLGILATGFGLPGRAPSDPFFFPRLVAASLLPIALILVVRGALARTDLVPPWSPVAVGVIAGVIGAVALLAPAVGAPFILRFGPSEHAAAIVFQLAVAVALACRSRLRALGMALLGLLLATVGTDVQTGMARFTLGLDQLADGIAVVDLALGLIVAADGVLGVVSPSLLLATYLQHVRGWKTPRVPALAALAGRLVALLAIAASLTIAFGLNNSAFDVGLLLLFAAIGVACKILSWNRLVLLAAFGSGPTLEQAIRQALMLSQDDPATFVRWPISAPLMALAVLILLIPAVLWARRTILRRQRS